MSTGERKIDLTQGYIPILVVVSLLVMVAGGAMTVGAWLAGKKSETATVAAMSDDLNEVKDQQQKIVIDQALMRDDIEDLAKAVSQIAGDKAVSVKGDAATGLAASQ